jgi:8-oxo-dGTP pyrophosphatase MutT (NUDIX family)
VDREASPQPRRRSVAAVALIRRLELWQTLYLTQWNPNWRALHLIAGHKHPEESFRVCLIREVGEELGLSEAKDFVASSGPLARLDFDALSGSARQMTAYTMEVFGVELIGDSALAKVEANSDNRWVTEAEIRAGRCADGTRVSPTIGRILTMLSIERP